MQRRGVSVSEPTYALDHASGRRLRAVRKCGYVFASTIRFPRTALACLRLVRQAGHRELRETWRLTANLLYIHELSCRGLARSQTRILDQGIVQAFWSIDFAGSRPLERDSAMRLLRAMVPVGTVVVLVLTSTDVVRSRLARRRVAASRLERRMAAEGPEATLERAIAALRRSEELVADLAREQRVSVIKVENAEAAGSASAVTALDAHLAASTAIS